MWSPDAFGERQGWGACVGSAGGTDGRGWHHFLIIRCGERDVGFPGGTSGKELTYPYKRRKRCGFDP